MANQTFTNYLMALSKTKSHKHTANAIIDLYNHYNTNNKKEQLQLLKNILDEYVEIEIKTKTTSAPAYVDGSIAGGVYETTYTPVVKNFNIPKYICADLESACQKYQKAETANLEAATKEDSSTSQQRRKEIDRDLYKL